MARYNLLQLDRHLLYVLIFLAVLVPLFLPPPKTVRGTPEVEAVYDR